MSTIAITSLPIVTTGLAGDIFPIVQNGATSQITNTELFGSVPNLTVLGTLVSPTVNGITVGKGAGSSSFNTAVGELALGANTSSSTNTAMGYNAMKAITTGSGNTAFGAVSLTLATTTGNNTAFGRGALFPSTGTQNTALGYNAGGSMSTGSKNVIIGSFSGNDGGLDIRTLSNYIVLSDGDANVRAYWNGANATFNGDLTLTGTLSLATLSIVGVLSATSLTTSEFTSMSGGVNTIASASGITPVKEITFISGTAAIETIATQAPITGANGTIILIPTGAFTWTTAGNIAIAGTAVVGKALHMTYTNGTGKWYPSYV